MNISIWYHGTSKESAEMILVGGFHVDTHFTPYITSALSMGGPYVFTIYFDTPPSDYWEWCTPAVIGPERIHSLRKFDVEVLYFNAEVDRAVHKQSLLAYWKSQGEDVTYCDACEGNGELGIIKDGSGLLPWRPREDSCIKPCIVCGGHGVMFKELSHFVKNAT